MDATAFQSTGKPKTVWCVLGEVNNDNTCHNNDDDDGGGGGDGGGEDDNDDDTEYEIIKLVYKV